MEEIRVFGTGHAIVEKCYNTCFALKEKDEYFLVDAGGGSQILTHLKKMDVPLTSIHHFFISHCHSDHITGSIWILRMISQMIMAKRYQGNLHIYGCDEVIDLLKIMYKGILGKQFVPLMDDRIIFHYVEDGDTYSILGETVTFFDIHSTKMKQFGFTLKETKLIFPGDEPYNECCDLYCRNMDILIHEAFCIYQDREIYHPYFAHHSTPVEAANTANRLGVKKLILWHSEDQNYENKPALYAKEAEDIFKGEVIVPKDDEVIKL